MYSLSSLCSLKILYHNTIHRIIHRYISFVPNILKGPIVAAVFYEMYLYLGVGMDSEDNKCHQCGENIKDIKHQEYQDYQDYQHEQGEL